MSQDRHLVCMCSSANGAHTRPSRWYIRRYVNSWTLTARSPDPRTMNFTFFTCPSPLLATVANLPNCIDYTDTLRQALYRAPSDTSAGPGNMPNTPQGPPSYSPLGLADIRSRSDTLNATDIPFSPSIMQETEVQSYPDPSNYVAPWPIYAVDWCKWPPRTSGASTGKIAIGSYLEDNHNYVRVKASD